MQIVQIIGSLLAIVASWYVSKQLAKWLQAYRTKRQQSEVEEVRKDSQAENQQANSESDKLKEIDGR